MKPDQFRSPALTSEVVTLDPEGHYVAFEDKDWRVCPTHFGLMHYLPIGATYYVDLPQAARNKELISPCEFTAELVEVRDTMPSRAEQIEQGRAAIAVFLIEKEIWNPRITEVPDPPKIRGRRRRGKELVN